MHLDVLCNGVDSHIMAIVCLLSYIRPLAFLSWSPPMSCVHTFIRYLGNL